MPWFQRRRAVAEAQQRRLWCRAREKADIRRFIATMDEGQLLDGFHALEKHIAGELRVSMGSGSLDTVTLVAGCHCVWLCLPP